MFVKVSFTMTWNWSLLLQWSLFFSIVHCLNGGELVTHWIKGDRHSVLCSQDKQVYFQNSTLIEQYTMKGYIMKKPGNQACYYQCNSPEDFTRMRVLLCQELSVKLQTLLLMKPLY